METHPSYPAISSYVAKYPRFADSLFQTYNDVLYSQKWKDVELLDLEACCRGAIRGQDAGTGKTMSVVPCSLADTISFSWQDAFPPLGNPPEIYLAITSTDASIVYYKISAGIVKPPL
ncbi:tRNA intron endonuclease [Schizophyllum amplum]|uniref:tRNA intron endonuclease n=1 Tax=Schizophyllum amplum TaxID=97359 RepID=A0A550CIX8_9AGAR|nr:tRNA intron endonuclease [Auriculariopsis ampla]